MPKTHNQWFGAAGETQAANYLVKIGYQVLIRNFRYSRGEVDIIAQDGDEIVFVEVKSRSTRSFAHPSHAVTQRKVNQVIRAGVQYLKQNHLPNPFRLDIISILPGDIEHYKNVTW